MNPERGYIEQIIGHTPEEQYGNSQEELSLDRILSKEPVKPDLGNKGSSINEVVSRSEEDVERVERRFAKNFGDPEWEKIKGREVEKSEEQIRIIDLANDETNKLRKKFGLKEFDIEPDKIHLLKSRDFDEIFPGRNKDFMIRGLYEPMDQSVIHRKTRKDTAIKFARTMFHELSHFKKFQKILSFNRDKDISRIIPERARREEGNYRFVKDIPNAADLYRFVRKDQQRDLDLYLIQCGLSIKFGKKDQKDKMAALTKNIPNAEDFSDFLREGGNETREDCFVNIDEAVIEESALRFQRNVLFKHPDFQEEVSLIKEYVERQKKIGVEVDPDEIVSARKTLQRKISHVSISEYEPSGQPEMKGGFILQPVRSEPEYDDLDKEYEIEIDTASYIEQREILNILIDKLYARNMDKFKDREEVFDVFVRSSYTGNIVGEGSWGRLVADTFGSKALMKLAECDKDTHNTRKLKKFIRELR